MIEVVKIPKEDRRRLLVNDPYRVNANFIVEIKESYDGKRHYGKIWDSKGNYLGANLRSK